MRRLMHVLAFSLTVLPLTSSALASEIPEDQTLTNWPAPLYWKPPATARVPGQARTQTIETVTPLPFVATTPCRQYDSRNFSALADNTNRAVTLTGLPCGIPANAPAISVNVTVFDIIAAAGNGVFQVGIANDPPTAWINYPPTETQRGNAGIVSLSGSGQIVVKVNQGGGSVDFTVDVNGYYDGNGVITGILPGTGMTGGGTAGTVTLGITPGGVTSTELAANSVTSTQIAANAVTAGAIASGQVVKSVNGAADGVTVTGSGAISVNTAGSTVTVGGGTPSGSFLLGNPGDTTIIGEGYSEFGPSNQDAWLATTTTGAPSGRTVHTAIWTGTSMIVWGGYDGTPYANTGGRYDPVADSWSATTTAGAPSARSSHTAVWTGTTMIIWGGYGGNYTNTGGRYDPVGDSWSSTTTTGAPSGRGSHTAVWTGARMIVWGGTGGASNLNTGGRYDPVADSWSATTTTGAPSGRSGHTAVWTGTRMIIWSGVDFLLTNTGGRYDPIADTWSATTTTGAPSARYNHTAVWTGARMIVWGGRTDNYSVVYTNTGGRYDPVTDSWSATATTSAPPARQYHTAVWTGARMIVWGGYNFNYLITGGTTGGYLNTGGQYDPVGDFWWVTTTRAAPSVRLYHTAVWAGTRMIVWGGRVDTNLLNTGGRYSILSLYVKN